MAGPAKEKATDAKPAGTDDLEERRRQQAAANGDPLGDGDEGGKDMASIEARAAAERGHDPDEDDDQDPDGQMVMGQIAGSLPVDLRNLIPKRSKVELVVKIMQTPADGQDGLIDPNGEGLLIVAYEVAYYKPVPVRERKGGQSRITSWKIEQWLRPTAVADAESARGRAMLGLPPIEEAA